MLRSVVSFDRVSWPFAGLAVVGCLAVGNGAAAVTLKVHPDSALAYGPPYYATVLEANAVATSGDSIEVSSAGSPYVQTASLVLVDGVVYRGGFGSLFEGPNPVLHETILQCQLPADSLEVTAVDAGSTGSATVFAGFTVTGGQALFSGGGVACLTGCSATILNCRIVGNASFGSGGVGGGIFVGTSASPRIFNCEIRGNTATERGGGIAVAANSGGTVIDSCRIVGCTAALQGQTDGGGGGIFTASPILITRCEIDSCTSGYRGGGLLTREADAICSANQFKDCYAEQSGGACYHQTTAAAGNGQHVASSFDRCHAHAGSGGALFFETGAWLVRGCFIRDCVAGGRGGGVYYQSPTGAVLRLTEVLNNTATRGGGVGIVGSLFRSPLSVSVESCTIVGNTATFGNAAGGGIHVFPEGNYLDSIVNSIVARQAEGSCIAAEGALNQPNIRYDCVWNAPSNPDPPYGLSLVDRTGINGNIKFNPMLCDTLDIPGYPPQLTLQSISPCIRAGEGGIDMGAHPGATPCAAVAIEETSWGRIKALFR